MSGDGGDSLVGCRATGTCITPGMYADAGAGKRRREERKEEKRRCVDVS